MGERVGSGDGEGKGDRPPSGRLASSGQKSEDLFGEFFADSCGAFDGFLAGRAESGDAPKFFQEGFLFGVRHSGAIVEQTLGDSAFHEKLMVAIGKAMRLIANALEHFQGATIVREDEGQGIAWAINFLEFLG